MCDVQRASSTSTNENHEGQSASGDDVAARTISPQCRPETSVAASGAKLTGARTPARQHGVTFGDCVGCNAYQEEEVAPAPHHVKEDHADDGAGAGRVEASTTRSEPMRVSCSREERKFQRAGSCT